MVTNLQQYFHYQDQDVKILYVEEEKFTRDKLLCVLKRRFANVYAATDGVDGYDLYQRYHPELIICALKMNQLSELEMIKKIRALNDQVQVIVTTNYKDQEYLLQTFANHVNQYILKPIDLNQLYQSIQKSVYHIHLEQAFSKQKKMTRALLDFQDNLIFIIENDEIIEFNQAFSKFTGICKDQTLLHKNLSSFFVDDAKCFSPINKSRWFEELKESRKISVNIHWKDIDGRKMIFTLRCGSIPGSNQYIVICKDITNLEDETRKNRQLVLMDSLTNSVNSLEINAILEVELRRAERLNQPFSMILMDIDFLNDVNKRYGQQACDKVLSTISIIAQQRIRETDIFARWGVEEFILLTPGTDGNGAQELAESIRTIIEEFHFQNIEKITCSFGISEFSNGKVRDELILEANQALTQSKDKGRNCVTIYN
ncbi:diguanylate cyclase [Bacillus sp. sid0103]|uniref:diguanylate cyclase domain-containing protein n=1 Tax=Bacillus sp. sid0103 TaxID=2856337 RepID=UPI001C48C641|nr:diguanylate cyclase [Bacillus sp. sid0103]MBV7506502.1 diguanylate cyclase [Bacillus sp. sid0103]